MLLPQHEYPARISPQKPAGTLLVLPRTRTENLLRSSLGFHPTPRSNPLFVPNHCMLPRASDYPAILVQVMV